MKGAAAGWRPMGRSIGTATMDHGPCRQQVEALAEKLAAERMMLRGLPAMPAVVVRVLCVRATFQRGKTMPTEAVGGCKHEGLTADTNLQWLRYKRVNRLRSRQGWAFFAALELECLRPVSSLTFCRPSLSEGYSIDGEGGR